MAILVRKEGESWSAATRKKFDQEHQLRDLLLQTPALIEVLDGSKLILTREAGLSAGTSADLLGVTSDGDILIVEAKLAKNYEMRRKVVGQIFEYASRLWETRYSDFDNYFRKTSEAGLIAQFSGRIGFDADAFRAAVDSNLQEGRFHLLIAVDEINQDLLRILKFISSRGNSVKLEALEVQVFQCGDIEMLVPQRHAIGGEAQGEGALPVKAASIEELLAKSVNTEMRSKIERVVDLWRSSGNSVMTTDKTICLKTLGAKKLFSMMWATPNEEWALQPNLGGMTDAGMPEYIVKRVREDLAMIPGVPPEKTLVKSYPTLKYAHLPIESVVRITEVLIGAAKEWHELLAKTD